MRNIITGNRYKKTIPPIITCILLASTANPAFAMPVAKKTSKPASVRVMQEQTTGATREQQEKQVAHVYFSTIISSPILEEIHSFDWARFYPAVSEYIKPHHYFYLINHPSLAKLQKNQAFKARLHILALMLDDQKTQSGPGPSEELKHFISSGHAAFYLLKQIENHTRYDSFDGQVDDDPYHINSQAKSFVSRLLQTHANDSEKLSVPDPSLLTMVRSDTLLWFSTYVTPRILNALDTSNLSALTRQSGNSYFDWATVLQQQNIIATDQTNLFAKDNSERYDIFIAGLPQDLKASVQVALLRTCFSEWKLLESTPFMQKEEALRTKYAQIFVRILQTLTTAEEKETFLKHSLHALNFNFYEYLSTPQRRDTTEVLKQLLNTKPANNPSMPAAKTTFSLQSQQTIVMSGINLLVASPTPAASQTPLLSDQFDSLVQSALQQYQVERMDTTPPTLVPVSAPSYSAPAKATNSVINSTLPAQDLLDVSQYAWKNETPTSSKIDFIRVNGASPFRLSDKIASQWLAIGNLLGIESDVLESISDDQRKEEKRLKTVINKWFSNAGGMPNAERYPLSWQGLINLLEDCNKTEVAKGFIHALNNQR